MAWNKDLLKKFLKRFARPETMEDLGIKVELSVLTPNGIVTKDISDQMKIDNIKGGVITFSNDGFISTDNDKAERTVLGVQLVDKSKMRSGLDKGEKES